MRHRRDDPTIYIYNQDTNLLKVTKQVSITLIQALRVSLSLLPVGLGRKHIFVQRNLEVLADRLTKGHEPHEIKHAPASRQDIRAGVLERLLAGRAGQWAC